MKFRIIIAGAALLAALIGIWCLTQYAHSPTRAAVGIATELASKMGKPPGGPFEVIQTRFLDSYDKNVFYVALDFKGYTAGAKLQEVFYCDQRPKAVWKACRTAEARVACIAARRIWLVCDWRQLAD